MFAILLSLVPVVIAYYHLRMHHFVRYRLLLICECIIRFVIVSFVVALVLPSANHERRMTPSRNPSHRSDLLRGVAWRDSRHQTGFFPYRNHQARPHGSSSVAVWGLFVVEGAEGGYPAAVASAPFLPRRRPMGARSRRCKSDTPSQPDACKCSH